MNYINYRACLFSTKRGTLRDVLPPCYHQLYNLLIPSLFLLRSIKKVRNSSYLSCVTRLSDFPELLRQLANLSVPAARTVSRSNSPLLRALITLNDISTGAPPVCEATGGCVLRILANL